MALKNDEKFEEKLTCHFKIDIRNLMNFENSKVSKIYTFMGYFWPNYIMFELKKYRWVMFNCTQDWYKIRRKTGLCFQKFTWGIWQIFTRALERLQIGTFMAYFCVKLKVKWTSLKTAGELCVMAMTNDAKFQEELTCQFKIDMRNLTNFDLSTRKSQKFAL